MALTDISGGRLCCYQHLLCPLEGQLSGIAEVQNPYRVWLAGKVEKAVEKALQYEGLRTILEGYALSRKWALPRICEERRLVTMKIHSLLLQWRPDFSVQWGHKVRSALPILETAFSLMACCIEDYSQPLLIEPRLKKVLGLLESMPCQSSSQQSLTTLFNSFQHCDLGPHSSSQHAAGKAYVCETCLHVEEEGMESKRREACQHASLSIGNGPSTFSNVGNVDEESIPKREQKTLPLCSFCLHSERPLEKSDARTQKGCSCRPLATDEHDDDSLEWSKANLHWRGTVATLMASELRSSRKEEANQALLNAMASQDVQVLEDNWNKHGKFASKWIVKKIMELQKKRSKKKERDHLCFKSVVDKLLHAVAAEKGLNASQIKRSSSKGILGFLRFSCHSTPASEGSGLGAFSATHSSNLLEASDMSACCLLRMHSKHGGGHGQDKHIYVTQAQASMPCSIADNGRDHNTTDSSYTNHHDGHNVESEGGSGIGSSRNFSDETDKRGGGLVCHHDDGEGDPFGSHGLDVQAEPLNDRRPMIDDSLDGQAEPLQNSPHNQRRTFIDGSGDAESRIVAACIHSQENDTESSMVPCGHIQDGNATSTGENEANEDLDSHPNVLWSDPEDSERSSASRNLSAGREDPLDGSQEHKDQSNADTGVGLVHDNVYRAPASHMLPAEESRDDEDRQEGVGRRVRVPLSSLLAEREDWSTRNPSVSSFPRAKSAWDAWEEPSEALDPLCCVCMIGLRGAAFTPCGHTFCRKCSRELWKVRGTCPMCNKLIFSILDIF